MNHLEKLNPLHKGKIQHPAAGYSNTLSQNVEDMHKGFVAFQKNLKNLTMLYKTRHQLMESLNENGLYTAKCYNEILGGSPLMSIVAPSKRQNSTGSVDNANSADVDYHHDGSEGNANSADAGALNTHQGPYNPDYVTGNRRLGPDEESTLSTNRLTREGSGRDPEGVKTANMMLASSGSQTSDAANKDANTIGRDPPSSTKSITSGASSARTEGTDHQSRTVADDGKSVLSMVVSRDGMNIIVDDDDDTFIDTTNISRETAGEMETLKEEGSGIAGDDEQDPRNRSSRGDASASDDEYTRSSASSSGDENAGKKEYLNISNDGELLVVTALADLESSPPPALPPAATPSKTEERSYYDVHKAEYGDMTAKLEGHSRLVQYVADWLETISTRVQSRYFEYGKHRTSLNHYATKVDTLLGEQEKARQKEKSSKPKQIEKLERNRVKLTGARETHDDAGEALLMLMDEVIRRSWRDAFPLLKGSIGFECDFAAITHSHMTRLGRLLEVLDKIGEEESVSMEGRLELLRDTKNMEEIFTGAQDGLFVRAS